MLIKNGREATKEILQIDHHSKNIFTNADHAIKDVALAIGAIIFMEKSFTVIKFIDNIKKALL